MTTYQSLKFRHGSLFSGIGGFDLAAEWMGWTNVFHCDLNPFGRKILKHHFPDSTSYEDITKTDFSIYRGELDILTGGFPCQPFSLAGKRKSTEDERYLWHEMFRAVQEIKPQFVIAENVYGIVNIDGGLVFEAVCADLEAEGYEVTPFILPACAKNAPHRRERCWFVAYSKSRRSGELRNESQEERSRDSNELPGEQHRLSSEDGNAPDSKCWKREEQRLSSRRGRKRKQDERNDFAKFPTQPPVCGGDDGIPSQLDNITIPKWRNESIKGYGNAIVPAVAHELFKAINILHYGNDEK